MQPLLYRAALLFLAVKLAGKSLRFEPFKVSYSPALIPVEPRLRIVTQLPLRGLWRDAAPIAATRSRALASSDVRDLLRGGAVQFVVAEVGHKLRWIDLADCYRFWMDEAQHHFAEPVGRTANDGIYLYRAYEWQSREVASPIVVLEVSR